MDIRSLTADRCADVTDLFESNGTTRGCWCMWFLGSTKDIQAGWGDGNRDRFLARAAAAVEAAREGPLPDPDPELVLLLAERAARQGAPSQRAPARIAASRYKDFVADYAGTVARLARPLPERPFRQTRLGTLFHAWVEQRSGLTGLGASLDDALWEGDEEAPGGAHPDAAALDGLIANFLGSEWASLQPIEVETEIDFADPDALGDGRPHVIICKLDAVYRRADGRIEIVDGSGNAFRELGRGAALGELALITGEPRAASIRGGPGFTFPVRRRLSGSGWRYYTKRLAL